MNRPVVGRGIAADPAPFARRADMAVTIGCAQPFRIKPGERRGAAG